MRTRERQLEAWYGTTGGGPPGTTITNLGGGAYDLRVIDPRYRLTGLSLLPLAGATQAQLNGLYSGETPSRANFNFLSAGGSAGAYGGAYVAYVERRLA